MLTYYQSRVALGSIADLALVSDADEAVVNEYFRLLWLALLKFERRCSRFLPASELSQFNRDAGLKRQISPEFRKALAAAAAMAAATDGLYNPFILPALQRAGYVHSFVSAHKDDVVDDFSDRSVPSPDGLELGGDWARIPYGSAVDLGGCGKGFAGDMLADMAAEFPALQGFWFSLGGDVVMGGRSETGELWSVDIEDLREGHSGMAGRAKAPGAARFAVATSSITLRKGVHNGQTWHHIIDPRTNKPAHAITATASVCTGRLLEADVFASCAIILSPDESLHFMKAKNAQGLLLQGVNGSLTEWGCVRSHGKVDNKR